MTTPKPRQRIEAVPVPTIAGKSRLAKLARRYAAAFDAAAALPRNIHYGPRGPSDDVYAILGEFDEAESALYRAMSRRGLPCIVVDDRIFMNLQAGPPIPDRPQLVSVVRRVAVD